MSKCLPRRMAHTHRTTIINSVGHCVIFPFVWLFSCGLNGELHLGNFHSLNSQTVIVAVIPQPAFSPQPPSTCSDNAPPPSTTPTPQPPSSSPLLDRVLIGSPPPPCKHNTTSCSAIFCIKPLFGEGKGLRFEAHKQTLLSATECWK